MVAAVRVRRAKGRIVKTRWGVVVASLCGAVALNIVVYAVMPPGDALIIAVLYSIGTPALIGLLWLHWTDK